MTQDHRCGPIALKGQAAFSAFRLAPLLAGMKNVLPDSGLRHVEACHVYFLEADGALPDDSFRKACELLGASEPFTATDGFLVTPRKGTISPWSSKATDIFRNCGLTAVRRVERGIHWRVWGEGGAVLEPGVLGPALPLLHDRMTEGVYTDVADLFRHIEPVAFRQVDVLGGGRDALARANVEWGLALSEEEMDYLFKAFVDRQRNPTDVELVMFGQVNSEHCRHKIFNAEWIIDGFRREGTLFDMIRNTHKRHPAGTLVAYKDNSAVVEGFADSWFQPAGDGSGVYRYGRCGMDLIMKVETHNHPTAISPFPGAATGSGGEIRDETATGIGGRSKAGLCGFMVSNLRIPGFVMPWEKEYAEFPGRLATPLEIMTQGPLGAAGFGNEFGRPQLLGLFRTYEELHNGRYRGYHKPIMLAGGMGNIKRSNVEKRDIPPGSLILQLGGPAMRIGLGGGAASSMATGSNSENLDFDSVQRDNPEMQRRCQEVIEACIAMDERNPILSIHDIGAGGLSNGCTELVAETGGAFRLRAIPSEDTSLSPMEIWCCEAQERYVLAIAPESLAAFTALCARERCPVAVLGTATGDGQLVLEDERFGNRPIDIPINVVLGKPPRMVRDVKRVPSRRRAANLADVRLAEAATRVLRLPAVASKIFLITIADRSVTGLVSRDQMVGPYQTPIADAAVTTTSFLTCTGEAMAMGERTPVALVSGAASGRMAVGEALTNLAGVSVGAIGNVKLSANWMCACGQDGEDAELFETVKAVGLELCPGLGVSIPVGKDSLSMKTVWNSASGQRYLQSAPLSLIVSAFAPVLDVRRTVTPDLKPGASRLLLLDLGKGANRLAASALAQVYNQVGDKTPDLDDPALFVRYFAALQELVRDGLLLAYHDRSDGGLFVTLAEMCFGGRRGMRVQLDGLGTDPVAALFAEELGGVLQVAVANEPAVRAALVRHNLTGIAHWIGAPLDDERALVLERGGVELYREQIKTLVRTWSEVTYQMQSRRDNPECAREEFDNLLDDSDPGMTFRVTFEPAPAVGGRRPRMAILREQGINGQTEMAASFDRAGFESVDVHMTDLLAGRVTLDRFEGLVACGGFSYGDVLGAGSGWARSVLFNERVKDQFAAFFARRETFALGVCNGCQMLAQLHGIIPGAEHWPLFARNRSERFEARYVTVEILSSPSVLLRGMNGARLPIPVAHGEGRAVFATDEQRHWAEAKKLLCMRYVDNHGVATERYPYNPNGSPEGITGLTTTDGRVTILMPHPERLVRSVQMSYRPARQFEGEDGPWLNLFRNARLFLK